MTLVLLVTCDGHRYGQPYRGALPTRADDAAAAYAEAERAGWHVDAVDARPVARCHGGGHDEQVSA